MAMMVLEEWGIHNCQDFGEIVFNMVENGGSPTLVVEDLLDSETFGARLSGQADPVSAFLWSRLSEDSRQALLLKTPGKDLANTVLKDLNAVVHGPSVYTEQRFAGVSLSEQTRLLLQRKRQGEQMARLNRFLLEDAYQKELAKSGGLLAKTERDSRADFKAGYDFLEAFRRPFMPANKPLRSEPTPVPSASN
jgi:hypothetical protein